MSPAEFWSTTPYEIGLMLQGQNTRLQERQQELIYMAWHIEALARQKQLPRLEKLLKARKPQKKLNQAELIAIAKKKGLTGPWERS